MPDRRKGQMWVGPMYGRSGATSVYLLLHECELNQYRVIDLMNGELNDFFVKDIETDDNWKRIA